MEEFIAEVDAAAPIDLVIANAGVSTGTAFVQYDLALATRRLFAVNVDGTLPQHSSIILPVLKALHRF